MKRHKAAFAVCSICLRVRRGGEWVEATDVIREIRSYEFAVSTRTWSRGCYLCAEPIPPPPRRGAAGAGGPERA